MEMLIKVSVVVPVYNTESYLNECIKSVVSQTYENFELILVDDGSCDNSGSICDKYALTDSRIKVIHQTNLGVTKARENGVRNSTGDYIYFVDADDTLEIDALENMLSLLSDDVDIVVSDYRCNIVLDKVEYAKLILKHDLWAVFMKLYRRSLFDKWVFDTPRYYKCGEDFLMQLRVLKNIKGKILCNTLPTYHYRNVPGSVSHTFIPNMEYEVNLMNQVDYIIQNLPFSKDIAYAHFKFNISYLGGMIGLKYPIDFSDDWVSRILEDSKKYSLTVHDRISIWAINWSIFRYILIAEKKLRHIYRVYIKRLR